MPCWCMSFWFISKVMQLVQNVQSPAECHCWKECKTRIIVLAVSSFLHLDVQTCCRFHCAQWSIFSPSSLSSEALVDFVPTLSAFDRPCPNTEERARGPVSNISNRLLNCVTPCTLRLRKLHGGKHTVCINNCFLFIWEKNIFVCTGLQRGCVKCFNSKQKSIYKMCDILMFLRHLRVHSAGLKLFLSAFTCKL